MSVYDLYKPKAFFMKLQQQSRLAVALVKWVSMLFRPRHIQGADDSRMRKCDVRGKSFCMNQWEPEIISPGAEKRPYQIRDQLELIPQQIKPAVSVAPSSSRSCPESINNCPDRKCHYPLTGSAIISHRSRLRWAAVQSVTVRIHMSYRHKTPSD